MPINFPLNPNTSDSFVFGSTVYVFDGVKWNAVGDIFFNVVSTDTLTSLSGFLKGDGSNVFALDEVFASSDHVHLASDVVDFSSAVFGFVSKSFVDGLGVDAATLSGTDVSAFAEAVHSHVEADIVDLDKYDQATVDSKDDEVEAAAVAFAIALG